MTARTREDGMVERVGARVSGWGEGARSLGSMIRRTATMDGDPSRVRLQASDWMDQLIRIGVDATWIVAMLGGLMGIILAFQATYQLRKFGAEPFMAEVVSLGMVREFGVIVTAIILTGRTGAAIAAELGTMKVNEEIDALRSMGIDPVRFLVVPRMVAITLMFPPLALMASCVGIACALGLSEQVGLPWLAMLHRMTESLVPADFVLAFVKSILFAWVIGLTGCFLGLSTTGGAKKVGENTTRTVVVCIFMIIVVDALVTTAWTLGGYGD